MNDSFGEKIIMAMIAICLFIVGCTFCLLFFEIGEQYGKIKYEKIILDNITTERLINEISKRAGENSD